MKATYDEGINGSVHPDGDGPMPGAAEQQDLPSSLEMQGTAHRQAASAANPREAGGFPMTSNRSLMGWIDISRWKY